MKRFLLFTGVTLASTLAFSQGQIGNSDMEQWESVAGEQEPVNWSSFLDAQGPLTWAAANQIEQSSDVRPGSAGSSSARVFSRSVFGIVANGNLTCGRINMGSSTATDASNYNISLTSDSDYSEALTDTPDSIVFWAKYNPVSGSSNARMKATLHDNYDYRDPEDAASADHIVATAVLNYSSTNGNWQRFAVPFDYSGPASGNTHILVTFASNETPGGGNGDDEVFIDDVELVYANTGGADADGDGVIDTTEDTDGTDPNDQCSFVLASQTVAPSAAWEATDCDFDGVSNGQEVLDGTDPLVHNSSSIDELAQDGVVVYLNNETSMITIDSEKNLEGDYAVYNTLGQMIQRGKIQNQIEFVKGGTGIYYVHLVSSNATYKFEVFKK